MVRWLQASSWRGLRLASGVQERLRRRFTAPGRVLLAGTLTAGLFGIDPRQTLAFQAFSLGILLLLLAWLGSLRRVSGLQAKRRLPRYATVGEPCRYRVEVSNHGARPAFGLIVQEGLPDPRPDLMTFLNARAPHEHKVNPVDRLFAYPRWCWLVEQSRRCDPPAPRPLPELMPGATYGLELDLTPRRRGVLRLEALRLSRSDLFGLGRHGTPAGGADRLLVLPKRYPCSLSGAAGKRRLQPGGLNLASAVGESQEFIGLRDYRPGDSPRHIHWAAWARYGAPVVKEYQDEYFSRQALILDSFIEPGQETDFEVAVSVAASLVEPLRGADSLLDLMFVADQAYSLTSGRGQLSGQALLEILAAVEPVVGGRFDTLSRAVTAHAGALSACVCVLLGWDAARRQLIESLLPLGLPLRVLLIGGPEGPDPGPLAGRPGDLIRLDPADPALGLAKL